MRLFIWELNKNELRDEWDKLKSLSVNKKTTQIVKDIKKIPK